MRAICRGLAYIHSQEIFHRDLKPENVLRSRDGAWAIADFGIARVVAESSVLTETYDVMGTYLYMAPEQLRDSKHIDERADVYSAGKIMQAFVCGGTPQNDDVPPSVLRGVIQRAIAPDRQQRYRSATELLAAIEAVVTPAPVGRWETPEEKAVRLVPRLYAGRVADQAAFDELVQWADEIDLDGYSVMGEFSWVLSALPAESVTWWWVHNPATFTRVFLAFAKRLEGSFPFGRCDQLADFAVRAVRETSDPTILREATRGLAELGQYHNRWHVRDMAVAMLQAIRDTDNALAALEGLRMADKAAVEWTIGDSIARTLHPTLRAGLASFLDQ
jgi:hypothetical protein